MNKGFISLFSVMLITSLLLISTMSTIYASFLYSQYVDKHEYRIQARLNARSCRETAKLLYIKDYFINGKILLNDLNCNIVFANDNNGNAHIDLYVLFEGVKVYEQDDFVYDSL